MLPDLSEEFRLYHNLWRDPSGERLIKVNNDGSEEVVAEISSDSVRVRTKYLRQFQAARQLDLLLFIDSVVFFPELDPDAGYEDLAEDLVGDDHRYFLGVGSIDRKKGPFSRFNGKRVLPPPAIDKAGVWPFDNRTEEYPEFIIGEDDTGDSIRYTCNPSSLANYFGANPGAPNYLTPVFFRRDVLQRTAVQVSRDPAGGCAISWGYWTRSARAEIRFPGSAVPISQGPAPPAWQ